MGHSEAGPPPRTAERFARELHALLQHAGVPGPYVLVGHSMGGAPVRVFAHAYAPEVVGVVLIEAMNPGAVGTTAPATPPDPGRCRSPPFLTFPARVGLVRVVTGPRAGLAPDEAKAYAARSVTVRSLQAALDEGRGMAENSRRPAVTTLGDVPLIVLSRGLPEGDEQKWQREQTELLQLSSQNHQCSPTRADTASSSTSQRPRSGPS